ncbi:ARM repeat superfamily protein [Striga hermonthica]|uniref:ARM repeat superfamily protein n=1 Tax=Striga hermonthica TaxID=68872 RepID=A0A9N7MUK9_STRHE|nr:ARM repeat superfamily protein [Striga hermonthica]
MPMPMEEPEERRKLLLKITRIFDDVRTSHATHNRKLKELATLRSSSPPPEFCAAFCKALTPLFNFQRRTSAAERVIKFASVFACSRGVDGSSSDEFLENFLKFLLVAAGAADKTARFRACQIVSEIIMRLPDDAEVSNGLWDEVIDCMMLRVGDKSPIIRTFAARALARFASDSENNDILDLFLERLQVEQNGEVRKIIVMSLPPSTATLSVIIDSTLDVNESVRKAAYCVLAIKFPLQSLSIKLRTTILQRGLTDRSTAVQKECLRIMKDEWLEKCCNGDPIELLKFLDVETYESVGECVMATLLKAGLLKLHDGQTIRSFFISNGDSSEGHCSHSIKLMDAEIALFWRMVCKHLHMEAQAKYSNLDVQRASVRCLGLFGLLEKKPSEVIVKQLRLSFIKAPPMVAIISAKALLDLGIWHGLDEMDRAMNCNLSSQLRNHTTLAPIDFCNESEDLDIELLDLLFVGLGHDWGDSGELEDNQSIQGVLGEGLAKILLLSSKFSGSHVSTHHLVLAKLVSLYFSSENDELQRLKQCLSVFFEHYPSLSANHKKCISKAFVPVIRSLWPGIHGNASGSNHMVSNMRKRAAQASRFMLQMMQVPLIVRESTKADNIEGEDLVVDADPSTDFESGEEGLAIRIAVEVASFPAKKSAAEKSYVAALCRILVLLQFRVSEQEAAKLTRGILNQVIASVAAEKDLTKELRRMTERLQAIDQNPEVKLSPEQANLILEKLELEINLDDVDNCRQEVPPTPAARPSARRNGSRRRAARGGYESSSSDEEVSPNSVVPTVTSSRSQRASKTAAMKRMAAKPTVRIDEDDDDDVAEGSEVTSEDDDDDDDDDSESFER